MINVLYCARLEMDRGRLTNHGMWAELMYCVPGLREGVSIGGAFAVYPGKMRYRADRDGG